MKTGGTKKQLVDDRDYASIANGQTNILSIFEIYPQYYPGIYSLDDFSRGIPGSVLWDTTIRGTLCDKHGSRWD
jgi:hypothetical protein